MRRGSGINQINTELTEDLLLDDEWGPFLVELTRDVKQGVYDQWLVDAIGQRPKGFDFDIYDAFPFSAVLSAILNGDVVVCGLQVSSEPKADECVIDNNDALKALSKVGPFHAEVKSQKWDDDGVLYWTEPILMGNCSNHEEVLIG